MVLIEGKVCGYGRGIGEMGHKGELKGEGGMGIQVRIERSLELKNVITNKRDVITSFIFFLTR